MEELDWSAGSIMDAVERCGIADRTLVIWTSDNGAVEWDPRQGSNEPLRGWGYNTSEGAQRVPFVARLPGIIPEGSVCREVSSMMDLLPTIAGLAGTDIPETRQIDGFDMLPLLRGDYTHSPYDKMGFFYYQMDQLQAVRAGRWKLYLPLESKIISNRIDVSPSDMALYDLEEDISEEKDRSGEHPEVVGKLMELASSARRDLGDLGRRGDGCRTAGWVDKPVLQFPI
jgi:arylsulfatase A-like enzyme